MGGLTLQEVYYNISHLFRLIKQESGEKFDKFLVRLRHQSLKCKFTAPDEHMIDQITKKMRVSQIKKNNIDSRW